MVNRVPPLVEAEVRRRLALGGSIRKVADATGIDRNTVLSIKNDDRPPRPEGPPMIEELDALIKKVRARVEANPDLVLLRELEATRERLAGPAQEVLEETLRASAAPGPIDAMAIDAATLPSITSKQAKVLEAIRAEAKRGGHGVAHPGMIIKRSGLTNIQDALSFLLSKGHVKKNESGSYSPRCQGEPRIEEAPNAHVWPDDDQRALCLECWACYDAEKKPDFEALGELFSRSAQAVEAKARSSRWYPGEPSGLFAFQIREAMNEAAAPPAVAPAEGDEDEEAVAPEDEDEDKEEEDAPRPERPALPARVPLPELSEPAKEVLLAIRSVCRMKRADAPVSSVASQCSGDRPRVEGILTRLALDGLAECHDRSWRLTSLGETAADAAEDER